MSVLERLPIAALARARYACRSPTFDPSAIYATSIIRASGDNNFGVRQRARQRDVRLSYGDTCRANSNAVPERRSSDAIADLLEKVYVTRVHDGSNRVVERAIIDNPLPVRDVDAQIDLDRLRRGPLVRQDSDERVKAHGAQRDLDHAVRR